MKTSSIRAIIISILILSAVYLLFNYLNKQNIKALAVTHHLEMKGILEEIRETKCVVVRMRLTNAHEYVTAISGESLQGRYPISDAAIGDSIYKAPDSDTLLLFKPGGPYKFLIRRAAH
jgi:hypothetical protein